MLFPTRRSLAAAAPPRRQFSIRSPAPHIADLPPQPVTPSFLLSAESPTDNAPTHPLPSLHRAVQSGRWICQRDLLAHRKKERARAWEDFSSRQFSASCCRFFDTWVARQEVPRFMSPRKLP